MAKGGSTPFISEDNVFFRPGFTDPKPNLISRAIFDKFMQEFVMRSAPFPRFSIPDEVDPENPPIGNSPPVGQGDRIPSSNRDRVEVSLLPWSGGEVSVLWSLACANFSKRHSRLGRFQCFLPTPWLPLLFSIVTPFLSSWVKPFGVILFVSWNPNFIDQSWDTSHPIVTGLKIWNFN